MMIDQKFPETRNTFDSPKKGDGGTPNPETQYLPKEPSRKTVECSETSAENWNTIGTGWCPGQ
jgi:hypothetical protein